MDKVLSFSPSRRTLFYFLTGLLGTGCAGPGSFVGLPSPALEGQSGVRRDSGAEVVAPPREVTGSPPGTRAGGSKGAQSGEEPLEEVVLTAGRREENLFDIPRAVTVVGLDKIDRESRVSILDTLEDQPGIWVEKRTMTASDPVIRGFSGAYILALVDGCSLSTLWGEGGEGGDDMYGKVDSESVERIEVIRGPGSALYGSNALGGVINFITRSCPVGYTKEGIQAGGRTKGGYGSASQYVLFRQEGWLATPELRLFGGGTTHHLGDTEGGRGVGTQHPTGGRDWNYDFKGSWKIARGQELELSGQSVDRDRVRRFYRPNEANYNDRDALTLTWRGRDLGSFFDAAEGKIFFQDKRDERKDYLRERTGEAQWRTFSGEFQFTRVLGETHTLTAGAHFHQDKGQTPDDEQFTISSGAFIPFVDEEDKFAANDELGVDIAQGIGTIREWGLDHVDLRGQVLGKAAEALPPEKYTPIMEAAWEAAKAVTPAARIIGGKSAGPAAAFADNPSAASAKKWVKAAMVHLGLEPLKLSARTRSFEDLGYGRRVFVKAVLPEAAQSDETDEKLRLVAKAAPKGLTLEDWDYRAAEAKRTPKPSAEKPSKEERPAREPENGRGTCSLCAPAEPETWRPFAEGERAVLDGTHGTVTRVPPRDYGPDDTVTFLPDGSRIGQRVRARRLVRERESAPPATSEADAEKDKALLDAFSNAIAAALGEAA